MVKQHARAIALGAIALGLLAYLVLRGLGAAAPQARLAAVGPAGALEEIPRIDLGRLGKRDAPGPVGERNPFSFGEARPKAGAGHAGASAPPVTTPPIVAAATPAPPPVPAAPSVPPLNVKYIGSLENKQGLRVAILLTDRKEILTGQQGELVANRFKIMKIGYESVDIQDVGSERTRRIPFKGN